MIDYKTSDYVAVETKEDNFEGTLMPSDKKFLVLKLDSGYNIGIDQKKIKAIKLINEYKKTKKIITTKPKKGLTKISILHTGGTIASKVDYTTGGVIASYKPEELIELFPELNELITVHSRLVGNIMSENMRFGHYNILAKEVEKEVKKGAEGVIITHGTDTIHYTSAALSFALQKLPIPVILVGAQRSSDRPSSDAAMNLVSAAIFIANSNFSEVAICMHENVDDTNCLILPGLKTRKMHS
jgi:glutamyl-tRNA(Gln) amidotransferase subunit D